MGISRNTGLISEPLRLFFNNTTQLLDLWILRGYFERPGLQEMGLWILSPFSSQPLRGQFLLWLQQFFCEVNASVRKTPGCTFKLQRRLRRWLITRTQYQENLRVRAERFRHYRDNAELFLEVKKEIADCGLEELYQQFLFLESIISKKGQIDPAKYRGRNLVGKLEKP